MAIELPKPIAVTPVPNVRYREFTKCGQKPLAGGKIWTYEANSTTPKVTYKDPYGITPNTNPIILDAAGEADIYLNGTYRFVVEDKNGVIQKDVAKIGSWYSGDLDDQFKSLNDALETSAQQLMQPLRNAIDTALAAGAAGWDANLVRYGNGTQENVNDVLFRNTYYAEKEGFKGDNKTDNYATWLNLKSRMNHGDVIVFKSGIYYLSQQVEIDKVVRISGQIRMRDYGTIFRFNQTGGIVRKIAGIQLEQLTIKGSQTPTTPEINKKIFGAVGLYDLFDGENTAGYTSLNQIIINGFDTGRLNMGSGTAIWGGAYRENYAVHIQNNKVGYVALNGITHEKFYGGIISGNSLIGVWSEAPDLEYNNVEFIGTTIEKNGSYLDVNSRDVLKSLNIYSGKNSKVKLIGGYNESSLCIAKDGGIIHKMASHEHINSFNFASDANINTINCSASYENKVAYSCSSSLLVSAKTRCAVIQGDNKNSIHITGTANGSSSFTIGQIKPALIKNKDIQNVRLSFKYKFSGGFTSNQDLIVTPLVATSSKTPGRTDVTNPLAFIPLQLLKNTYNETHSFQMYYKPRTGSSYLDDEGLLDSLSIQFAITNSGINAPDFTKDNLILEISDIEISLLSNTCLNLNFEPKSIGATDDRPIPSALDAGLIYYDTSVARAMLWDGSRWSMLFNDTSGVSFLRVSSSDLQTATNLINTQHKYAGKIVFNNTTQKMYYALGSEANTPWRAFDASVDIIPA